MRANSRPGETYPYDASQNRGVAAQQNLKSANPQPLYQNKQTLPNHHPPPLTTAVINKKQAKLNVN